MTFESFVGLYREDIGARIKETTWETKDSIIDNKLIPYFGKKCISDMCKNTILCPFNLVFSLLNTKYN